MNLESGVMRSGLSRRGFLIAGAAGALGVGSSRLARAASGRTRLGVVLGAGLVGEDDAARNVLSLLDLDDPHAAQSRSEIDFYGHGITPDPLDPSRIALFQKAGKGACTLDIRTGSVLAPIETADNRDFYGHGAFSPDGKLLYATESILDDAYRGVIVVRDAATLEELGQFPSFGARPHDCVLRDGGATMVITNGGGRGTSAADEPSVTYVDVASEKLVERVSIGDPDIGSGHLALTERGDLAIVSAARGARKTTDGFGAVSFRAHGGELVTMEAPSAITGRMRGESLSVAIHDATGVVGITNPAASLVTFWDIRSARFVGSLDLAYPRGIATTLDGSRFVIAYGMSASLVEVDAASLEPIVGSRRRNLSMTSSHIVVHTLA